MANIEDFGRLIKAEHGLVTVSVPRGDGTISSSVVKPVVAGPALVGQTGCGGPAPAGRR